MAKPAAKEDTTNKRLMKQLECPVCFEYCVPPIYMCKNGHNVCSKCTDNLTQCGTCREPGKPAIRNLAVEGISELLVKVKCKNADQGCQNMFNMQGMQQHLPKCEFNLECGFDCRWKGNLSGLETHVASKHSNLFWECDVHLAIRLHVIHTHFCYCLTLMSCGGHLFWYSHEYDYVTKIFAVTVDQVKVVDKREVRFSVTVDFESKNKRNKRSVHSMANDGSSKSQVLLADIVDTYQNDEMIPFKFLVSF